MDEQASHDEPDRFKLDRELLALLRERTKTAAAALQLQLDTVRQMGGSEAADTNALSREIAILDVCIHLQRGAEEQSIAFERRLALDELALNMRQSAGTLAGQIETFSETAEAITRRLAGRIDALAEITDKGTHLLARWTMWLAFATAALVATALWQAHVMETAPPQVVVAPAPPTPKP